MEVYVYDITSMVYDLGTFLNFMMRFGALFRRAFWRRTLHCALHYTNSPTGTKIAAVAQSGLLQR